METLERLLREHPFLQGLTEEQVRFLTGCAANARMEPGQFVFREGEDAHRLYLVRDGRLALEIHLPGKGTVQVETVESGDILGWSWLFPPYRWDVDARAVADSRLLAFDGTCLRNKMEADPALGFALTKRVLRHVGQRLERVRLQRLDLYATHS